VWRRTDYYYCTVVYRNYAWNSGRDVEMIYIYIIYISYFLSDLLLFSRTTYGMVLIICGKFSNISRRNRNSHQEMLTYYVGTRYYIFYETRWNNFIIIINLRHRHYRWRLTVENNDYSDSENALTTGNLLWNRLSGITKLQFCIL